MLIFYTLPYKGNTELLQLNPRSYKRSDSSGRSCRLPGPGFNPRSHKGNDTGEFFPQKVY